MLRLLIDLVVLAFFMCLFIGAWLRVTRLEQALVAIQMLTKGRLTAVSDHEDQLADHRVRFSTISRIVRGFIPDDAPIDVVLLDDAGRKVPITDQDSLMLVNHHQTSELQLC